LIAPLPITFLSDYGHDDEFAGVCRAVIVGIAPEARLIDLTHGIRPEAIREGGAVLAKALPYAPAGVHLAVVDPGVGGERRGVAARAASGRLLVGPDNGLLTPALARFGGAAEAVDLAASPFRLAPVSVTFHGRDVFAPVAARLALGAELADAGTAIDPSSLVELEPLVPRIDAGSVTAHVTQVDRFGNAALDLRAERAGELPFGRGDALRVAASGGGAEADAAFETTFASVEPGRMLLYEDSYGNLALAVNLGSAAELLDVAAGDAIVLRPAGR
jgi:S-adenosyl-L-methionine hydrolase (adenosine-forming)